LKDGGKGEEGWKEKEENYRDIRRRKREED
jgi:hypothetical protein